MSDIYFIYDEECPLCSYAAHALRIKQSAGTLHLINARDQTNNAWVQKVNERGLDLDEGMVILYADNFYHGQDALHLMGLLATDTGWFNKLNAFLFRSKSVAKFFYPVMRAVRNMLIKIKGVSKIDNLNKSRMHSQADQSIAYVIRHDMLIAFLSLTFFAAIACLVSALNQWSAGSKTAIESYSFCVIFPATLIAVLALMKGTKTKEGLLMRFGTMTQLLLIICLPHFSLYLALGLPVVFLVVELLVTRLPSGISLPLERMIIK